MNTLQKRVQKVISYLESERGKKNWSINIGYGYDDEQNMLAAIMTAAHLIKVESILEVLKEIRRIETADLAA